MLLTDMQRPSTVGRWLYDELVYDLSNFKKRKVEERIV